MAADSRNHDQLWRGKLKEDASSRAKKAQDAVTSGHSGEVHLQEERAREWEPIQQVFDKTFDDYKARKAEEKTKKFEATQREENCGELYDPKLYDPITGKGKLTSCEQ